MEIRTRDGFEYQTIDVPVGIFETEILPKFYWPDGVGSADGIRWYAAITNPEMTVLIGEMGMLEFGWNDGF